MDVNAIIGKYYKRDTQLFHIYMIHARMVTKRALEIVDRHPELNADRQFVYEAAMLHDIGIFMTYSPKIYCEGDFPYICHGYLGHDLMCAEGYERHALVCERHTGIGITLEEIIRKDLPIPRRDMCPVSIEEKIICFADKFFSKSRMDKEKSISKIRKGLEKHGVRQVAQFDEWCNLFL